MGWFVGISTRTPTTSISFTATPSSPAPHVSVVPCRAHGTPLSTYTPCPRTRTPAWAGTRDRRSQPRGGRRLAGSRARVLDARPRLAVPDPVPAAGPRPWRGHAILTARPGREAGLAQRGLDQDAVQPEQQGRNLPSGPPRSLPGLRAALAQRGRDNLLDQRDIPVRRRPRRPQVPGLHPVGGQHGDGAGDIERVLAVEPSDPADQAVGLELGQLLLVNVRWAEPPVSRRRARRADQALGLEKANLRDADIGKLAAKLNKHLADSEVGSRKLTVHAVPQASRSRHGPGGPGGRPAGTSRSVLRHRR